MTRRRHVYGVGHTELENHPDKFMRALFNGRLYAAIDGHQYRVERVQFYNGGSAFKVEGDKQWYDEVQCNLHIVDQR